MIRHRVPGALAIAALALAMSETVTSFATFGSTWAPGDITMNLQLAGGSGATDGSAGFNAVASEALSTWNLYLARSRFVAVIAPPGRGGDGDFVNQVFFDSSYYGSAFGPDTLAITTRWTSNRTQRVEADVVLNSAFTWDSYRGNVSSRGTWDVRRILLHEFGHALGLDHPDQNGQHVDALMNSILGNRDALTPDDVAGAQSLYGRRAVPRAIIQAPGPTTFR
jgi:hypothetical protein